MNIKVPAVNETSYAKVMVRSLVNSLGLFEFKQKVWQFRHPAAVSTGNPPFGPVLYIAVLEGHFTLGFHWIRTVCSFHWQNSRVWYRQKLRHSDSPLILLSSLLFQIT